MARQGCSTSKISVWWDIENCHVPRNVDPHYIAQNLRLALHHANLNGPITIDLFGDTRNLDHKTLEALSSTGITINHIPSGNKDAADKAILVAMLFWALDNSPPAHFLLISGDGDFANALHRLRLKGYDILLARPDQPVKPALLGAATSIWYWTNVAKGQIHVAEELKQGYEESSVSFSSNTMRNDDFNPSRQVSLPKISGHHNTLLSGASAVSLDKGLQTAHQRTASLQESEQLRNNINTKVSKPHQVRSETNIFSFDEKGLLKCQGDTSLTVSAHSWVSDCGSKTSISCEDMRRFNEDKVKLVPNLQADEMCRSQPAAHIPISSSAKQVEFPSSKQPGILGHQPLRPGDERTGDKRGIPFVSSNKIPDHTKAPRATTLPMPKVVDYLPSLTQDAMRAYSSNIPKVMKTFETLKLDGLLPTQDYLQDCLRYWDKQHGKCNLKQVLDQAVHQQHIVKVLAGEGRSTYFLPCNTKLWKCHNIYDMMYVFSDELWKDFHQFLCCSKNWQFFVHSQSMYEAAQRLKGNGHSGIRDLAIGEIILFLNQAIQKRNWLSVEITPTFVLSIKAQVIMELNPSEGATSPTLRVAKDDKGFVANGSCTRGSSKVSSLYDASAKMLIFEKLRTWLLETSQTKSDYDISLVPKDFQKATGIYLDIQKLGFAKLQGLIEEFDDVVTIKVARIGLKILCPVVKANMGKLLPSFETSQDEQQRGKPICQSTVAKGSSVATNFAISFQDKEKQGCSQVPVASTSQRSGVPQIVLQKQPAPDGVSPNHPMKHTALDHPTPACSVTASKDVAQHAHPPPPVTMTSWNAGGSQNSSGKASHNHPSLKKLRSWLLQSPSLNHGYDLSLIKKDFHEATGIVLDPPSLGYPKVKDILNEFRKDFHIESPRTGLWLVFRNNKNMRGMTLNADSNTHHLARESNGHAMKAKTHSNSHHLAREGHGHVSEEATSKSAQSSAENRKSSQQWKELHPTLGVKDGENVVATTTDVSIARCGVMIAKFDD